MFTIGGSWLGCMIGDRLCMLLRFGGVRCRYVCTSGVEEVVFFLVSCGMQQANLCDGFV